MTLEKSGRFKFPRIQILIAQSNQETKMTSLIYESERQLKGDGIAAAQQISAFPLMNELADGSANQYPALTSLKPVEERQESELHPSQVHDLNDAANYYTYSWMLEDAASATSANYIAFGSLLLIIAVTVYFVAGTKLVKFVQFFITQKHYSNLSIKIKATDGGQIRESEGENQQPQLKVVSHRQAVCETSNTLGNNCNNDAGQSNLLLAEETEARKQQERTSHLCGGLAYHASELVQFYTPVFSAAKLLSRSKRANLALPKYVMLSQIVLRGLIIVTLTVTSAYVYLTFALSEQERNCVLSRDMKNTSYQCLNENSEESTTVMTEHKDSLFVIGVACAVLSTMVMFGISQSIFSNFTKFLNKLLENEVEMDTQMSVAIRQINIPSSDTVKQASPKKNRKSPNKRKYDSVSSFRALLANDSDGSMIGLNVDSAGYDSGAQMSMSTQANNLLGLSERASSIQGGLSVTNASHALNISQQSSSRLSAANMTQNSDVTAKPRGYTAAAANNAVADLLPIDEDVDDEKCSPIKPKKRTQEDSPFKRNMLAKPAASVTAPDHKNISNSSQQLQLASDEEIAGDGDGENDNHQIAIGGLEIGAKQQSAGESMSFGGCFQLMVEKIDGDANEQENDGQDHFEGLRTLNSGHLQTHGDQEASICNKQTGVPTRNHPSINANSFSGVEDSTLQLDSIAGIRPHAASSSKNAGQNQPQNNEQNSSSFIITQQNDDESQQQQPHSVRNERPGTGQINLGLMTPIFLFPENMAGASHEVQTEDKNSMGLPYARHGELLSSDQISKISNSQRPESAQRVRKPRRVAPNQLPPDFEIEQKDGEVDSSARDASRCGGKCKVFTAISVTLAFIFGVCMSVYLLHSLPGEAVNFILIGLLIATVCDLALQLILLAILAARQLHCDLRKRKLPLDTVKLRLMTASARGLATQVFSRYREESALLQVGYQDEIDIMLDKLERDIEKQSDSNSGEESRRSSKQVGPKDILVKDSSQSICVEGFIIEICQKLKFRPPKNLAHHSSSKLNIVQPGTNSLLDQNQQQSKQGIVVAQTKVGSVHHSVSIDDDSDSNSQKRFQRRKIRLDVSAFERTQQFFADQKPKARNANISSPQKRSATILRQSIDNIELEKLESDFPSRPQSKEQVHQQQRDSSKSQTPDGINKNARSSLAMQSSNNKASQFETPKAQVSQVKLKHAGSNIDEEHRSEKKSEVRRKLVLKRSSVQTIEGSKEGESKTVAGKLSAVKNYLEDAVGGANDLAGMILNKSSSSIVGAVDIYEAPQSRDPKVSHQQQSSIEFQDNMCERFVSQDKAVVVNDDQHYTSFDRQIPHHQQNTDVNQSRDHEQQQHPHAGQETYSPMFSSVNRKPGNDKIEAPSAEYPSQATAAGNNNNTIPNNNTALAQKQQPPNQQSQLPSLMSRSGYENSNIAHSNSNDVPAAQAATNQHLVEKSASKESSNKSKIVQAIMSHKEVLSKHQSFNSPTSLQEQLQLTNEKIKNSLDGSSLHKGRRKMVMLDEAGVSKQSLNFGPQNIGTALLNSSAQRIPFLHQSSIGDSSGERMTPIRCFDAKSNIMAVNCSSVEIIKKPPLTAPGRVLMQDQRQQESNKDGCVTPQVMEMKQDGNDDDDDDEQLFMNYAAEVAEVTAKATQDRSQAGLQQHHNGKPRTANNPYKNDKQQSEYDKSSIFNSQIKRLSLQSNQAQSAKTGNDIPEHHHDTGYKNDMQVQPSSHEKTTLLAATETKNAQKTSAFQRLVMASKRMMQKKSSEKKDGVRNRRVNSSNNTAADNQVRSSFQCSETISIMKEQASNQVVNDTNKAAIFAQPFRVGSRKQQYRSSSSNDPVQTAPAVDKNLETEQQPPHTASGAAAAKPASVVKPTKHTIASLQVLAQQSLESTFKLPDEKCERISEILEHESMEIDTPLQPSRIKEGAICKDPNNSGVFIVPATFSKEQVNPVKNYTNSALLDVPIDPATDTNKRTTNTKSKQQLAPTKQTGGSSRLSNKSNRGSQDLKSKQSHQSRGGFKQRKNSQMTQKDENYRGSKMARRNSKNSNNVPKTGGTHEKRKLKTHNSSRENTVSSMSIDFEKMDKQREEDYSDYSKMISAGSTISRLEDQRRRLESFLSLAQQAKSKRDIHKIQDMIKQIDETQKPLPMTRINELKLLELMASPYNQSLIAMIKVELDISRKMKELKKANQQQSNHRLTKSKFTLPKHLTTQNSQCFVEEVLKTEDSKQTFDKQFEITKPVQPESMTGNGVLSDNRLTTVVNIRPQGIQSCRSNNDVAQPKTFNRSPSHRNQSPLSVNVCKTVLSGKRPMDKKVGENGSALESCSQSVGRYSYLRSVGNAVVRSKEEVRNSVDRINLPSASSNQNQHEGTNHLSVNLAATTKPDLLVESLKQSRITAAEGRRGTAPHFGDGEQGRKQIKADFLKPDFTTQNLSGGPQSPSEMSSAHNIVQADVQKRSTTSYGVQQIGPMMHGREGFVKRISPLQSKSALAQNKENQSQPKIKK